MSSVDDLLDKKEQEYNELQLSYTEYINSSKELEQELEQALEDAVNKLEEVSLSEQTAIEKSNELEKQIQNLLRTKDNNLNSFSSINDKEQATKRITHLENENENILNQIRILEATEENLQHKIDTFEEEVIYLKSDIDIITNARCELEETIKSYEYKITISDEENSKLIEKKDKEIERLKSKLSSHLSKNPTEMSNNFNTEDGSKIILHQKDKEIDSLKQRINTLVEEKTTMMKDIHKKDINHRQLVTQLQDEITLLNTNVLNITNEVKTLSHEKSSLAKEQCLFCADKLSQADKSIEKLRDEVKVLTSSLTNRAAEIEKLKMLLETNNNPLDTDKLAMVETQSSYHISDSTITKLAIGSMSTINKMISDSINSNDVNIIKEQLSILSQKYERLQTSNVKLLAKLQSIKGSIQVCCRTRPSSDHELQLGGQISLDASDENELLCYDVRLDAWKSFNFDKVWSIDANQTDVFADVEPIALSCIDGYNACIFAYGQTGSGKTFTMDGSGDQYGVSYRAIQKIIDVLHLRKMQAIKESIRIKQMNGSKKKSDVVFNKSDDINNFIITETDDDIFNYSITISMMEIYNEQVYDLLNLNAGGGQTDGVSLDIRQDADNHISVPGLKQMSIHSLQDVMTVFSKGASNRATSSTNINEHSSRSHLIIQIDVVTQIDQGMPVKGKLYLVDLAGSEKIAKSGVKGVSLKEAQHINKSLSALGDVMEALDQKSKHIPYRNSKLTYLLQNSLGGNSRTMMIVTVCPTSLTFEETLFTLQFATRVRNISLGPAQKQSHIKNLEVTIKSLRTELKEVKKNKAISDESIHELKKEIKKLSTSTNNSIETKTRSLEEAKRSIDLLNTQLTKQLQDSHIKLSEEREIRENHQKDLIICQKSLKKALEQIKEYSKSEELSSHLIKKKEMEIEKLRNTIETLNSSNNNSNNTNNTSGLGVASSTNKNIQSFARRVAPTSATNMIGNNTTGLLSAPKRNIRTSISSTSINSTRDSTLLQPTKSLLAYNAAAIEEKAFKAISPQKETQERNATPLNDRIIEVIERLSNTPTASILNAMESAELERISKEDQVKNMLHPDREGKFIIAPINRKSDPSPPRSIADSESNSLYSTRSSELTLSRQWIDAIGPTSSRLSNIYASEAEHALRREEMANATHPIQDGRFIVSPARSRSRDVSPSINSTTNKNSSSSSSSNSSNNNNNMMMVGKTINGTNGDDYRDQSPSRRFSLANVSVPTISRLSYIQATEEEQYSLNNLRSSSINQRSTFKMTGYGIASTPINRSDMDHDDNEYYRSNDHNSITNESSLSPKSFIHSEKPPMILSNKTSNKTILHQRDPSPNLGISHRPTITSTTTTSLNNQFILNNTNNNTTYYATRINNQQEDAISTIKRIPILSARSEEAMRKHQARMEKKREININNSTTVI